MIKSAQVFKIHSDFYYVHCDNEVIECKLKDTLKKQKQEVVVGDIVVLEEINEKSKQAFISQIEARKSFIPRPKVANIEQMIIVSAIKEPELDVHQLNRYLCLCEYHNLKPILCFNKNDLAKDDSIVDYVFDVYEKLGYEIIFTSALDKIGIDDLEEILEGKTSALCGMSGVGKSTLINAINPELHLKTKSISEKTNRGTHTTRHCEIIPLTLSNGKKANIIDTPGFSYLKFDFLLPQEVENLFPEFRKYKNNCKFSDCLHTTETGCKIIENIDTFSQSRYESYTEFINEAKEYKEKIAHQGHKKENNFKFLHDKKVAKISTKNREKSRNVEKQTIKNSEENNG